MKAQPFQHSSDPKMIIKHALEARTVDEAKVINDLIACAVGEKHWRPVADRANNHGLMGGAAPSYDALLVELLINGVDSALEYRARRKYPHLQLNNMSWKSPRAAAQELLAGEDRESLGRQVQVHLYPADSEPQKSKRISTIIRDYGVGLSPRMVANTVFHLGSKYKDDLLWQHGAYGLGGAMTYRNAEMIVLVCRRRPEFLDSRDEDRITVAVCEWQKHTKGMGLYYLVRSDWSQDSDAEPWSVPASSCDEFEPGLHIALIGFQTKKFHRRKSDRDSFENMMQTRISDPVWPIGLHNHVATGDHFKIPEGNRTRFEKNLREDRDQEEDTLIIDVGGKSYKLPIHWYVFKNGPNANVGGMRTFVWDKQAVHFTNNGYAHKHWSQQELRVKVPKLKQVWDRLHVLVETDALPIDERTALFSPDRSAMRDTPTAHRLEKLIGNYLQNNDTLRDIDRALIKKKLEEAQSGPSTRKVAEKISRVLQIRGFNPTGHDRTDSEVAKPTNRVPKKLYPNPTAMEGPNSIWVIPGDTKHINIHINALDDFLPDRASLKITTSSDKVPKSRFSVGKLKKGRVRVQLAVPSDLNIDEKFNVDFAIDEWILSSGGMASGQPLQWQTSVKVVAKPPTPHKRYPPTEGRKKRKSQGKQAKRGEHLAVLWRSLGEGNDWDKTVPGHAENIEAQLLAEHPEYKYLEQLGDEEIQTIWLNIDYAPLKSYTRLRIANRGASEKAIEGSKERYAIGVGVALVDLANNRAKAERNGSPYDEDQYKHSRHAAAQGVTAMLPEYDALMSAAGIDN